MKEKWSDLDREGRIRLIIFALLCAWCAYCVIGYCYEIYHLTYPKEVVDTDNMQPLTVDGTDFSLITFLFMGLGEGINSGFGVIAGLFVVGLYSVFMVIMTVIPLFLYWFFAVRKVEDVYASEAELAMNVCGLGGFISVIGGLFITLFSIRIPVILYTLIWMALAFFIVVVPLRKRVRHG